MKRRFCSLCNEWQDCEFREDDLLWVFECGGETTQGGQLIIDRNFGRLYDLDGMFDEPTADLDWEPIIR